MKTTARMLMFVFMLFLVTPTVVSVLEKNADISIFYSVSEEEKSHKEIKALVYPDHSNSSSFHLSQINSGIIHSENLSKHDKIASKIFIPPPEQV